MGKKMVNKDFAFTIQCKAAIQRCSLNASKILQNTWEQVYSNELPHKYFLRILLKLYVLVFKCLRFTNSLFQGTPLLPKAVL